MAKRFKIDSFKKWLNHRNFKISIFLIVFLFSFVLRAHNYDKTPDIEHLEEMLYAWSGLYLIETGTPVSWSTLYYPKRAEVFKGEMTYNGGHPKASVTLYKPWLDEPPLFSLLIGGSAHLFHANRHGFIPSGYTRVPMIIIGTLASLLVFGITWYLGTFYLGILALVMYSFTPLFVFASRTAVPENLFALFLLIIVGLLLWYEKHQKWWILVLISLLAGIAGLCKPTGFFLLPIALFLFFVTYKIPWKKMLSMIFISLAILAPFVGFFFWWGLHLDAAIFWQINSIQALRPVGFSSLPFFFVSPAYYVYQLIDAWYIFSLVSLAYFLFRGTDEGKRKIILYATVGWLFVVMISGGEQDLLPWYRFTIFPLLAIVSSWGIVELWKKMNFFAAFLWIGILLGNRYQLVNAFRSNITPSNFRIIISLLLLPAGLLEIFKQKYLRQITQVVMVGVFVIGLYFNMIYIYNQFEIICEQKECPIGPGTKLSEIYIPFLWKFMVLH